MDLEPAKQKLFEEFLSELTVLDDFRKEYEERYGFQGLGRDDQDVQRLIEAMAFYRARTRATVRESILQYKLHALEQLFPYLLSPMPAMALLYPVLDSNMTDTRVLPRHAELLVVPPPAEVETRARYFRSCQTLAVYPLRIIERSVRLTPPPSGARAVNDLEGHWMLQLDVAASITGAESKRYFDDVKQPLRELCLYINPLGDVLSALRLFDALERHCRSVTVRFFADGVERYQTSSSRPRFGAPRVDEGAQQDNPIESARRMIHFPLSRLCMTVPLVGAPSEWTRFSVEFRLDEGWPSSLHVSEQSFALNAVPLENLVRRSAEPIEIDGTVLRHRLQAPEQALHLTPREVIGVYASPPAETGASAPRQALFPRSVFDEGYSVTARGSGAEREVWLETDVVLGTVTAKGKLYVDAEWYDPEPSLPSPRLATVRSDAHDLGALRWQLADPLEAATDSPLLADAALLDRLLQLQGRAITSARELALLFRVLGVEKSAVFGRVPRYLRSVEVGLVPDAQSHSGATRNYDIVLAQCPQVLLPAARFLFSLLPGVLGVWSGDSAVRVSIALDAATEQFPLVFEWRALGHGG